MPSWLKFTAIGCGGLLGLVILIGACGVILSGPPTEPETAQQGQDGAEQEPQEGQGSENPNASVGETVQVGDVAWKVTNARKATQLNSAFGDAKQGNFVIVDFLFLNNSNEAVTLDSTSLALLDGEGRKFEADTDSFEYIDSDKNIFLEQVNPGVTRQGQVIYTVAPDASDFTLQAGDTEIFSDENALIDLGF
jgi:hypothetical protein